MSHAGYLYTFAFWGVGEIFNFKKMAEFLDTTGVSHYLQKLINNSNDKLYLISPYLQLNNQIKLSIQDRLKFSIDLIIIYGKNDDLKKESEWLNSQNGIKVLFHQDLHAKCYFNENEAIITSMNLYMFSQQNNVEMGIYVSKVHDKDLYEQLAKEVDKIKRNSTYISQKLELKQTNNLNKIPEKKYELPTGYCIRTGVKIPFNIEKPLSHEAYKSWSKYGDADYEEKFCHFSGEPSKGETSVSKPILKKNWKKAQEIHGV